MNTLLLVNSSSRYRDAITRQVADLLVDHLAEQQTKIINRDLAQGLPFVDEKWVAANFTDPKQRTPDQLAHLKLSDNLVQELQQAEHIVIASPIYNFNLPAVLKAWIDLIARARLTFQYTEQGSEGLLKNKKAYLVIASGGVPVGSAMDFVSPYLTHVLGFIGISDITIIDANRVDLSSNQPKEFIIEQLN